MSQAELHDPQEEHESILPALAELPPLTHSESQSTNLSNCSTDQSAGYEEFSVDGTGTTVFLEQQRGLSENPTPTTSTYSQDDRGPDLIVYNVPDIQHGSKDSSYILQGISRDGELKTFHAEVCFSN